MTQTSMQVCLSEPQLAAFAEAMAALLASGVCVALRGDLGAGKTTFARALVRALADDRELEVPSPTFALRQDYETPRGLVVHFDFYRLTDAAEIIELGFDEAISSAITIVEWPERAETMLPADRIDMELTEARTAECRTLRVNGHGAAETIVAKLAQRT